MMRRFLVSVVKLYQVVLSPLFGDCCRFYPCCSAYCIKAINVHGCIKGLWLSLLRISKCHPFNHGGVDFVPNAGRTGCE